MKKNGTTTVLRDLKVGESVVKEKSEISNPRNLHGIAIRLGIQITLKSIDTELVKITRTK